MATPLTKVKEDATPYVRISVVEAAMEKLLALSSAEVLTLAEDLDNDAKWYLRTECLVHLVREAGRRGDDASMNMLLPCIFRRTEIIVLGKFKGRLSADIVDDVISSLGEHFADDVVTKGTNKLDFFEANFYGAVIALAITHYQKRKRHNKHFAQASPAPANPDIAVTEQASPEPSPLQVLQHKELCDAIDALPPKLKRAHVLHHVYGLKYESIDPNETTISKLMNVSGRTVQNYLEKAAQELKRFSEEI